MAVVCCIFEEIHRDLFSKIAYCLNVDKPFNENTILFTKH